MGFLKDIIERRESYGKMKKAQNDAVIWTTNPKFTAYIAAFEVDNTDVAFIAAKTVHYFRRALGLSLSPLLRSSM